MIPYTNDGLRDYRPRITSDPPRRWPWLLLLLLVLAIVVIALTGCRPVPAAVRSWPIYPRHDIGGWPDEDSVCVPVSPLQAVYIGSRCVPMAAIRAWILASRIADDNAQSRIPNPNPGCRAEGIR